MKAFGNRRGYAALPLVTGIALMITVSLLMLFRAGLLHRDQAAKAQLREDYQQREEALLRAIVAVFPQKAIDCMKANYAASSDYSWDKIFQESIQMAAVSEGLSADTIAALKLSSARNGDVGGHSEVAVRGFISSLEGVQGEVTPGTRDYEAVFQDPKFAGKVPPLLTMSSTLQAADVIRPIVSSTKQYSQQDAELQADITQYPTFNLIPYPNIRFGYATPGAPFVAKRNWWAFRVRFGETGRNSTADVPAVDKYYVLSLYEIPSQLPIEGAAFAEIGRHNDGKAWNTAAISITGGVYADRMSVDGGFGLSRLSGKEGIELTNALTLDGSKVDQNFDAEGVRETLQVERQSDTLPIALSANSGRLAFMPVKRGDDFLNKTATSTDWEAYTRGSERCQMTVEAIAMENISDQRPKSLRVKCKKADGQTIQYDLIRTVNWPKEGEPGWESMPFQTEQIPIAGTGLNRGCLSIYPKLLNDWLVSKVGAAGVAVNNSVYFSVDASVDPVTVKPTAAALTNTDMAVVIRDCLDLTSYTKGISLVTPLRVYVGGDMNNTAMASPPTGSGLPAAAEYYPPLSIFSGELRVGTTAFNRPIEHKGQVGTLGSGANQASWKPLDLVSGSDDGVHSDEITASLQPLASPAELPPIYQMNWLVVLEEIPQN